MISTLYPQKRASIESIDQRNYSFFCLIFKSWYEENYKHPKKKIKPDDSLTDVEAYLIAQKACSIGKSVPVKEK